MSFNTLIPLFVLLGSFIPSLIIFTLSEEKHYIRTVLNLLGVFVTLIFVIWMLIGVYYGHHYEMRLPLLQNLDITLRAGPLALFFTGLSSVLWFLTTIYAIGYLEGSAHSSRFFGFFSLCVTATIGVSLSGNLITFLIFYEMLTLSAYPLIIHRGTEESRIAGRKYLIYTIIGGALLMVGTVWLYTLSGTLEFTPKGFIKEIAQEHNTAIVSIFILLIAGFGVKAALFPLHGWLPVAMVAPAPVSALLHAVAVVKAGAFGLPDKPHPGGHRSAPPPARSGGCVAANRRLAQQKSKPLATALYPGQWRRTVEKHTSNRHRSSLRPLPSAFG